MAWNYKILPDEYQQVEYLQTDGNAYIDTGFKPNYSDVSTRITGVFEYTEPKTPGSLLGSSGYNKKYFYIRNPLYRDGIPEEYQQVEYIKSSGSQYIDTRILKDDTGNNTLVIKMQVEFTAIPSSEQVFAGVRSGNDRISISILSSGKIRFNSGTGYTDSSTTVSTGVVYDIEGRWANGKQTLKLNDEVIITRTQNGSSINNITIHLFECNYSTKYLFTAGQIYNTQIIVNDELIRDFVSCYRKIDNTGGFYDLITEEFYESAGTGNFVCGDIVPEEILDDPTVTEDGAFLFGVNDASEYEVSFSNQSDQFILPNDDWIEDTDTEYFELNGEFSKTVSKTGNYLFARVTLNKNENTITFSNYNAGFKNQSIDGITEIFTFSHTISNFVLNPGRYKFIVPSTTPKAYRRNTNFNIFDENENEIASLDIYNDTEVLFDILESTRITIEINIKVQISSITDSGQIRLYKSPSNFSSLSPSIHKINHITHSLEEKFTINLENSSSHLISKNMTSSVSFTNSTAFELDESLLIFAANKYGFIDYVNQQTRIYSLKYIKDLRFIIAIFLVI